jgi:hypothetical protein
MAEPIGLYTLNAQDLYKEFGFVVSSGSDDFLKMPTRKDPLSADWADQDGTDYNLDNPFFEDSPAVLKGMLVADSEADFWEKYYAFWAVLKSEGRLTLYINELDQNFYVFYKEMSSIGRLTRIKDTDKIGVNISITFQNISSSFEDIPPYVNLVVHVDTYDDLPRPGVLGTLYLSDDTDYQYEWSNGINDYKLLQQPGTTDTLREGSINLYYKDSRVAAYGNAHYVQLGNFNGLGDARYYTKTAGDARYPLKTDLDSYLPYTGATSALNLGAHSVSITGTTSNFTNTNASQGTWQSFDQFLTFNGSDGSALHSQYLALGYSGLPSSANFYLTHGSTNLVAGNPVSFQGGLRSAVTPAVATDVVRLSDLSTAVGTIGSTYLPLSGGTLTGDVQQATTPINGFSLINKAYVDNALTGLTWKKEVKAGTTTNITLSGTQTVDGIALIVNDRVLVKNQTTQSQNGIYIVTSGAWIRALDADTTDEIEGATVMVRLGTVNKDTQWTNTNSNEPVIGTDAITFGQISGAGTYTNGTGVLLTGNVFSLDLTYAEVLSNKVTTLDNSTTHFPTGSAVTAALAVKQPLEDQRLSTTNSPAFLYAKLGITLGQNIFGNSTTFVSTFNADGSQDTFAGWRFKVSTNELQLRYIPAFNTTSFYAIDGTGATVGRLAYTSDITALSTVYQPIENQRLSTANSPTFASGTFSGAITNSGLIGGSAGNFVVNGGSGLLVSRTAAQVLSDIGAAPANTSPSIVTYYTQTNKTTVGNLFTYVVPADGFYKLESQILINSITTNTIRIEVTYTDVHNIAHTISGTTFANNTYTGAWNTMGMFNNNNLVVKSGSSIIVAITNPTGGGTQDYDVNVILLKYK